MLESNNNKNRGGGFTLIELLMGLLVCSVILGAVGTLAFAMSSANEQTKDMSEKQAYIRYTSDRIRGELRQSVRMWYRTNTLILWKGDLDPDGDGVLVPDGVINGSELVYIETNAARDILQILEFPENTRSVTVDMIDDGSARGDIIANGNSRVLTLLPDCSNVTFTTPDYRILNISFDLSENGVDTSYDICGTLIGSAENMFASGASGPLKTQDDD